MGVEIRSETPRLLPQFLPAWFLPAARSSPDEAVCSVTSLSLVVSIAGACEGEGGEKKEKKKSFSTTRNPCSYSSPSLPCLFPTMEKKINFNKKKRKETMGKQKKKGKEKNWEKKKKKKKK